MYNEDFKRWIERLSTSNKIYLFTAVEVNSGGYLLSREAARWISTTFTDTDFLWLISECELRDLLAIGDFLTPSQLNYIHEVKHAKTSGQGFDASHSLCISLYMKLSLLRLFCVICLTCLVIFGYRRCTTRILKDESRGFPRLIRYIYSPQWRWIVVGIY